MSSNGEKDEFIISYWLGLDTMHIIYLVISLKKDVLRNAFEEKKEEEEKIFRRRIILTPSV